MSAYYGGCDPGESAGFCVLTDDPAPKVYLSTAPMLVGYAVMAVEGQYNAGAQGAWHKGRRTAVHHKTVPTLAFRAGRLSVLAGNAGRVLRLSPETWRGVLGYGGLSAEVTIAHLRRKLNDTTHTDDEIEAYGLALCARLIGTASSGAGWVCRKQDEYGWYDVTLTKPRAVRAVRPVGARPAGAVKAKRARKTT